MKSDFEQKPIVAIALKSFASVAALFAFVLCVLLVADYLRVQGLGALDDPQLIKLNEQYAASSGQDKELQTLIRSYDLHVRDTFFQNQAQLTLGGFMLLGAASLSFLGFAWGNRFSRKLPDPDSEAEVDPWELNTLFRQLLIGAVILLMVLSLFLTLAMRSNLTKEMLPAGSQGTDAPEQEIEIVAELPHVVWAEEYTNNWPSLRGPDGLGIAYSDAPINWNTESGEGVLWRAEIPLSGFNSPIVWGNRLFLSGGNEAQWEVYCYDADTGKQRWSASVESSGDIPEVMEETGFAAPTMATDGRLVFVIFATGSLAAFDFEGELVWSKHLSVPENPYGMGSSLLTDGERLFVQYDHEENQKVMTFDATTGNLLWECSREYISWASPVLIRTDQGAQLILNDEEFVTAYAPATGDQLWQVSCLGGEVAPSAAYNRDGIVFVANEYAQATALQLNESGAAILWQFDDVLPEIASPVATDNAFYIATTFGEVVSLDATTGDVRWEHQFDDGFNASPIWVKNRLYLIDIEGKVHIVSTGPEFELIAEIAMGEPIHATPAVVDGRIYIRGIRHLYCIGD